jgi:hypothetical protein
MQPASIIDNEIANADKDEVASSSEEHACISATTDTNSAFRW